MLDLLDGLDAIIEASVWLGLIALSWAIADLIYSARQITADTTRGQDGIDHAALAFLLRVIRRIITAQNG